MSLIHKIFRITINVVCLALSTSLIIYFLYNLSEDPLYRIAVFPAVVVIELLAQYVLSMGRYYLKSKKYVRGGLLIFCFVWYLAAFALFSALGYFNQEIAVQEKKVQNIKQTEDNRQKKIDEYSNLIAYYQIQANNETDKRGPKAKEIEGYIREYQSKRDELENIPVVNTVKTEPEKTPIDMFGSLAMVFSMPANLLKILVFGTLILFIYLGLTLTNWDIHFDVSNESKNETHTETEETNDKTKICPTCGIRFTPKRKDQIYHHDNCRLIAHRQNKQTESGFEAVK